MAKLADYQVVKDSVSLAKIENWSTNKLRSIKLYIVIPLKDSSGLVKVLFDRKPQIALLVQVPI